tara:strand:- start:173 stop:511 length:339 start_codon:yes stop_codon:yes gene_type:complete
MPLKIKTMKTLKESMKDFTAPFIEWESDIDSEVIQQSLVEAQMGDFGVEFSIQGSRDISFSHGSYFETEDVTVGDASWDIEIFAVFDKDFEDVELTEEQKELLINVITNEYE